MHQHWGLATLKVTVWKMVLLISVYSISLKTFVLWLVYLGQKGTTPFTMAQIRVLSISNHILAANILLRHPLH